MSDPPPQPLPPAVEAPPPAPVDESAPAPSGESAPEPPEKVEAEGPKEAAPVAETTPREASVPRTPLSRLRRWAFLAVPIVAVVELGAHLWQTHDVVPASDWQAARDKVRAIATPEDFIAFAPYWTDPLGREYFKSDLITIAREARADDGRFKRGIEVSIRGKHLPELEGWKVSSTDHAGAITISVLDNPSYAPVLDDLVDHVSPQGMAVSVVSGGQAADCTFGHGRVETGGLGFGPAQPADRFTCPGGGMLGATVMQATDYRPHRCLLAPPLGGGKTMRVSFLGVKFGKTLRGHTAINWDSEHHLDLPGVTLVWRVGERTLARIHDSNGDGWKGFELDTSDLTGQTGELVAEVSSPASRDRIYCFEASTR